MLPSYEQQPTIPAVVVGGSLNGLGVVRSLSHARMPVFVLDTTRRCPAAWSRSCHFVRTPRLTGESLIQALQSLATELINRPVLILTSDEAVTTVSEYRDQIAPHYRVSLPAREMVNALADKAAFQSLAEREGFAVPRGAVVQSESDLRRIRELVPPLIIKPADKILVLNDIVERAVRADTTAEAEASAARMLCHAPRLIVQEWVDGPDTEIFFTLFVSDRDSRMIAMFAGRKIACSPPAVGSTAICVAAPEVDSTLRALTSRFVAQTEYQGLGSLEFKRDAGSGEFLIIEPTVGRTDWQEEIATLCGVNLPLLAYLCSVGLPQLPSSHPTKTAAWRSSKEFRTPSFPDGQRMRIVDGYLRWSDPLPALYYYGYERLAMRIWRRAIRLTRRAVPHTREAR